MGIMPCCDCDHAKHLHKCDGCNVYEFAYKRYFNVVFAKLWNEHPEMRRDHDMDDIWFARSIWRSE